MINGKATSRDDREGIWFSQLAVQQGHALAQFGLGWCYQTGKGVEKDEREATRLFRLSAAQGYTRAQNNLGVCYENGTGVEKNELIAACFYQIATELGNQTANENLQSLNLSHRKLSLALKIRPLALDSLRAAQMESQMSGLMMQRDQAIIDKNREVEFHVSRIANEKNIEVAHCHLEIAERDRAISEARLKIAERDLIVMEKDRALSQKDQAIAAKDEQIAAFTQKLAESERLTEEQKNRTIRRRESRSERRKSSIIVSTSVNEIEARWLKDEGTIGRGAYGEVRKMEWMGQSVAVKLLGDANDELLTIVRAEASVIATLHHPCIVPLYGVVLRERCALVMEFCSSGTLSEYLKKNSIDSSTMIRMACEITSGLLYLHQRGIIHRTLKSGNVMLDSATRCKLADCALSPVKERLDSLGAAMTRGVGSIPWMAPEVVSADPDSQNTPHSKASDMYSLGITLWEIAARMPPYQATKGNPAMIVSMKMLGKHDSIPVDSPASITRAIEQCRQADPNQRPSANALLEMLQSA